MPRPSSFFPSAGLSVLVLTALLLLCFNTASADDDHDHVTPAPTPAPTHDDHSESGHDESDHGEHSHDESDHGEHSHDESDHGEFGHDDHGHEGHDHDHAHEEGDNDNTLKGVAIAVIFAIGVLFGFVPSMVPGFSTNKTAMSAAQTFSAGVFLATALAHMLPESTHALQAHLGESTFNKYNPSFVLCAAGYLMLLGLQRVVLKNSICPVHMFPEAPASAQEEKPKEAEEASEPKSEVGPEPKDEDEPKPITVVSTQPGEDVAPEVQPCCDDTTPAHEHTAAAHQHTHGGFKAASSYTLMAMLTCHGIIEGIALGLQKGSTDIGLLFTAIASHKWAEQLSLGAALLKQDIAFRIRVPLILSCAAGTPIGIAIGWVLVSSVHISVVGYFVAISAGTFVYLSLSEVVPAEFKEGVRNFLAFATFLLGFGAYYIVTMLTAHDHAH